jgi:hypothetical protein
MRLVGTCLHQPESLVRGKLLRDEREREEPPGEVEVGRKAEDDLAHARERSRLKRQVVQPRRQPGATFLGPELGSERFDRAVVDPELTVWITTGRQQEQGSAAGVVQLVGGELERLACEVGQNGFRVPELASLELTENIRDGVHS